MGLKKEDKVGVFCCCFFLFRVLLGLEHLASLIKGNSHDKTIISALLVVSFFPTC